MSMLTAGARRRLACELADTYICEQSAINRPITDSLPALIDVIRGFTVPKDRAIGLFDEFARARAICMDPHVAYDVMDAANTAAERLLDQLTGERPLAVAS